AFGADFGDEGGDFAHRRPGFRLYSKIQKRRETHCAEEAQVILFETVERGVDRPDQSGSEIDFTAAVVDQAIINRIIKHAVDRGVASGGIRFACRKGHGLGMAAIMVGAVLTESRNFKMILATSHEDHSEMSTDGVAARVEFQDLLGSRTGGDVVVL